MSKLKLLEYQRSNYAKVKVRGKDRPSYVRLPVLVGSSPQCDVIIHSDVVMPVAKVVYNDGLNLKVFDLKTKNFQTCESLGSYGVQFSGPFLSKVMDKNPFIRRIYELLACEQRWFRSLPVVLQSVFGQRLGQPFRMAVWVIAIITLAYFGLSNNEAPVVDKSNDLVPVKYETVFSQNIGSLPGFRAYRHGATFAVTIPEDKIGAPHVFHMRLSYLDSAGELVAEVEGQKVFESEVDATCLRQGCDQEFVIPADLVKASPLIVKIIHQKPGSDYLISDILAMSMRPLTENEWFIVRQQYQRAKRFFGERLIARENVFMAQTELQKITTFMSNRTGSTEFKMSAKSLLKEVNAYIESETEEVWFEARKGIKLRDFDLAMKKLQLLKEYFVRPSDPQYSQLLRLIEYVKEAKK